MASRLRSAELIYYERVTNSISMLYGLGPYEQKIHVACVLPVQHAVCNLGKLSVFQKVQFDESGWKNTAVNDEIAGRRCHQ